MVGEGSGCGLPQKPFQITVAIIRAQIKPPNPTKVKTKWLLSGILCVLKGPTAVLFYGFYRIFLSITMQVKYEDCRTQNDSVFLFVSEKTIKVIFNFFILAKDRSCHFI